MFKAGKTHLLLACFVLKIIALPFCRTNCRKARAVKTWVEKGHAEMKSAMQRLLSFRIHMLYAHVAVPRASIQI